MDLVPFLLQLHATTHAGEISGSAAPERWLGGLSDDQLRRRPGEGLNSIVWLLWHMARTEDVAVNLVVAGRAQVFDKEWARRMNVPRPDMGTGMTADEVAVLSEHADVAAVRRYRSAVGAFGPNDYWVDGVGHRPWQGITRGHQLGQTAIRHNTAHMGEGITLRSLGGFGLGV